MASFYNELLGDLNRGGVEYVVIGGLAVILHGVPRTTADLDLALNLEPENVLRFLDILEGLGFLPRAPVLAADSADPDIRKSWQAEKGMKAFTLVRSVSSLDEVDVVFDLPLSFESLQSSARSVVGDTLSFQIAGIDSLIIMKEHSGRSQDLADIDALRRIKDLADQ